MKEGVLHATQGRAISKFSSHDCSLSSALVVLRTVSETDQSMWRASTNIIFARLCRSTRPSYSRPGFEACAPGLTLLQVCPSPARDCYNAVYSEISYPGTSVSPARVGFVLFRCSPSRACRFCVAPSLSIRRDTCRSSACACPRLARED